MTKEGTLVHIDGRPALRFERRYRHPVERVWRAVSDPAEMASWFPSDGRGRAGRRGRARLRRRGAADRLAGGG